MRRVLVWLLLALLPWRLWAADAMALQPCAAASVLAGDLAHTAHTVPDHGVHAQSQMAIEALHATHAPAAADGTQTPPHANHANHAVCTLCDICHNTPLASAPTGMAGPNAPQGWPLTQSRVPPTAVPGPPLKPPIA